MKVVLHEISKLDDGSMELAVSFGDSIANRYHATYDASDAQCKVILIDHELFMKLSNLAFERFGNCTVYQIELMALLRTFCETERSPELPFELGARKDSSHRRTKDPFRFSFRASLLIGLLGFLIGLLIPIKGEIKLACAASLAFASWLIWTGCVREPKTSGLTMGAILLIAIPAIFVFVGVMHTLINY